MSNIILVPSLQRKLEKPMYRSHLELIDKLCNKVKILGKNALKILDVEDYYLFGELKVMKPPYRLYVIVDQKKDIYYIVDWEHKDNQERIIKSLKNKLALAIETGLEGVFS